eukprot:TRINITY_DN9665_c0_g1_i1.p1 TRINITY_DN9665_c0_g1~~TRINITY_DN9665_c0_g1_i1.p1  ORF type:complete len:564 (+),score=119.55 TRINITY_DN9665_c0_g1_i1:177-1868(+)
MEIETSSHVENFLSGQSYIGSRGASGTNKTNREVYITAAIETICRNQLHTLKEWAPLLDGLAPVKKEAIWRTCQVLPAFSDYNRSSFTNTIQSWDSNPVRNMGSVAVLYSAIVFLQAENLLPEVPKKDIEKAKVGMRQSRKQQLDRMFAEQTAALKNSALAGGHAPNAHYSLYGPHNPTYALKQQQLREVKTSPAHSYSSSSAPGRYTTQPRPSSAGHSPVTTSQVLSHQQHISPTPGRGSPQQSQKSSNATPMSFCNNCRQWLQYSNTAGIIQCPYCRTTLFQQSPRGSQRDSRPSSSSSPSSVPRELSPTSSTPPPLKTNSPSTAPRVPTGNNVVRLDSDSSHSSGPPTVTPPPTSPSVNPAHPPKTFFVLPPPTPYHQYGPYMGAMPPVNSSFVPPMVRMIPNLISVPAPSPQLQNHMSQMQATMQQRKISSAPTSQHQQNRPLHGQTSHLQQSQHHQQQQPQHHQQQSQHHQQQQQSHHNHFQQPFHQQPQHPSHTPRLQPNQLPGGSQAPRPISMPISPNQPKMTPLPMNITLPRNNPAISVSPMKKDERKPPDHPLG